MKEIPMLFSTPMVKAIMARRKTMTRRIMKPQPVKTGAIWEWAGAGWSMDQGPIIPVLNHSLSNKCPYGIPGDIIWVRESFNVEQYPKPPEGDQDELLYYFKATETLYTDMKWRPSIHMPKAASRIWLEVTDIRVERLHDINAQDVKQEGCGSEVRQMWLYGLDQKGRDEIYRRSFSKLWSSINGEQSWNVNPWVWVVSFKVLSTNGKPK